MFSNRPLSLCAIVTLAAAGPALSQSEAVTLNRQGAPGVAVIQPSSQGGGASSATQYTVRSGQPGPDAPLTVVRSYMQGQQEARQLQIDGKPVTLRATGASLQVYLADEPYPESRMKAEEKRTLLLDSGGKPAGQMLIEGQRVRLEPVNEGQQAEGRLLIGVSLSPVDSALAKHLKIEPEKASQISSVTEGWPASKAGLGAGDIIVAVEGKEEGTSEAIRTVIAERKAGDAVKLGVISGGERKNVTLTLSDEARASTAVTVGSVNMPTEYWSAVQLTPPGVTGQAATEYYRSLAQAGQWQEQTQRARELRMRQADQPTTGAGAGAGQRSAEVAEAQVRALREQLTAAQRDGGSAHVAEAHARALREQLAAVQRGAMADVAISEGARVTVDIPTGGIGGRAVVAPRPEGDISRRLSALEARMTRIEALLQQLTEQSRGR